MSGPGRADPSALAREHLAGGDPLGWFEPVYAAAAGDPRRVPWAQLAPDPHLVAWLEQPGLQVAGSDVLVVGCGLGDDAAELADRGCRVVALDISETAVAWAAERFGDREVDWRVADLLEVADDLAGGFGLVVEIRTAQSLPEGLREAAMQAIAGFVAPGGMLVHVGLLATSAEAAGSRDGPPWPLAPSELAAYRAAGLRRVSLEHPHAGEDGRVGEVMDVRVTLRRPA